MVSCYGCKKEIASEFVEALGHQWHREHFACAVCHRSFDHESFFEQGGDPYCERDYFEKFGKRCHGCGEPIRGESIEALGQSWHREHFVCTVCHHGLDHEQFFEQNEQPYCERDYYETFGTRCKGCGEAIRGEYVEALGCSWHRQHLVCSICRQPFADNNFFEHDGQPYCEHDYYGQFAKRCSVCREPIRGKFLTDAWDESFCERHQQEMEQCFSCSRLICTNLTGGGVRYEDGREICNICRTTAIDDLDQLRRLLDDVRATMLEHEIRLEALDEIPLRLAGLDDLDQLAGGGTPAIEAGMTLTLVTTSGDREISRVVKEVVILYGLPREHTVSIVAHEFGHVWCFLHCFPELSKKTKEGLCQLFAYICLSQRDSAEARYHMKTIADNLDPEYGQGFREAKQALSSATLTSLLERVRQTGEL